MKQKLQRNITILYVSSFFWLAMVVMPIIVPFFESKGLDLAQVFYLQAIFAMAVMVFEVPSGYVADVLGRKNALVAGSFFHGIGFTFMYFSDGFGSLVVVEIILGIGLSLLSGADLSLLYDTQHALEFSARDKARGIAHMRFIKSVSEGIAALLGGVILLWSFDSVVIVNAIFSWFPLFFSFFLVEAPYERMARNHIIKNMKIVVTHLFYQDKLLKLICLSITFFSLSTFYAVWLLQTYWSDQGIELAWFGVLWAAQSFVVAIAAKSCHFLEDRFGPRPLLLAIGLLPVAGYLGMAGLGGLAGLLVSISFFISRGWNQVILTDALNRRVPASFRATANSMTSFMFRTVFIVTGPVVGYLYDQQGMTVTLTCLGLFCSCFFLWLMIPLLRRVKSIGSQVLANR